MTRVFNRLRPLPIAVLCALSISGPTEAALASSVPHSNRVVILVMENQTFATAAAQPFTASLIAGGARLSNSFAVTHPSQPNYFALWSASTQGVTSDACPITSPAASFSTENLGHACESIGLTWHAYSEDLPAAGSTACAANGTLYTRKHDPWTYFTNANHTNERTLTDFTADVAAGTLPNLSIVVPNNCHNSHDGGAGCTAADADTWLSTVVPSIQAALGPDGVLILTWDEDDFPGPNQVLTVFSGPKVAPGAVSAGTVNHFNVTRTICDALGIVPFASAASATPITDVWAAANTITWTGSANDGSWHTPSNWDLNRIPGAGDDVVIPDLPGTASVTFSTGTTAINSLACSEALSLSGGILDIAAASGISKSLTLGAGANLTGAGNVQVGGAFTWAGGSMTGPGTTTIGPGLSWAISGNSPTLNGRTLVNDGSCTFLHCIGNGFSMNGGTFRNRSGATFDIQADDALGGSGTSFFDNQAGALFKKSAGTGTSVIGYVFTNGGAVDALTGGLRFDGGGTNNGSMTCAAGADLEFFSSFTFAGGSSLTPAGDLYFDGGSSTIGATCAFVPGPNTIINTNGVLALNLDTTFPTLTLGAGGTLSGLGNVIVAGAFHWTGGAMSGSGTTTLPPGVNWSISGNSPALNGRTLVNDGSCTFLHCTGNGFAMNGGTIRNRSGATFDIQVDDAMGGSGTSFFDNQAGALFKKSAGTGTSVIGYVFTNGGAVDALTGGLRFDGGGTNNGSMTCAAGADLEFFSSFAFAGGSSLSPAGDLYFDGGSSTVAAGAILAPAGVVNVSAALTVHPDASFPTLNLSPGGSLAGTGAITVGSAFNWTGGAMFGPGSTIIRPGIHWSISGNSPTVNGRTLVNDGSCTFLHCVGNGFGVSNGGVFRNRPGATFDIQTDDPIGGTSADLFDNQAGATLVKSSGAGSNNIFVSVTNAGTMQVSTGAVTLNNGLSNFAGTTLAGGSYILQGVLQFSGANIMANAAAIVLDGPSSAIRNTAGADALEGLRANSGSLSVRNGRVLALSHPFASSGSVIAGPGAGTVRADSGYTQTAGTTTLNGGSVASTSLVDIQGGSLTGTGTLNGTLRNAGNVAPGASPGAISITGNYTQTSTGKFTPELAGLVSGTQYDALNIGGSASLDGALNASLIDAFVPAIDDTFDILTAASRTGTFVSGTVPFEDAPGCVAALYRPTGVRLRQLAGVGFTQQPQSQTVCTGSSVTFSAGVSGSLPAFQWKKDGVAIPGATSSSFTISSVTTLDAGTYSVDVSNLCAGLPSQGATLTVHTAPAFSQQPAGAVTCEGSPLTLTAAAGGAPAPTFQWRKNGVAVPGATAPTLSIVATVLSDSGSYDVVATNSCAVVPSLAAEVQVFQPPTISQQPLGQTVCRTSNVNFTVAATGTGSSTQWRKNGVDIAGATSATLTLHNVQTSDAGTYLAVVTTGCGTATSQAAALVVNTAAAITLQPVGAVLCVGGSVTFTTAATGSPAPTFQWRKDGVNTAGATSASLSFDPAQASDAGNYDVVVQNPCSTPISNVANLVVNAPLVITGQPQDITTCFFGPLSFSVTATGSSPNFQWRKNGVAIPTGGNSATLALAFPTPADNGTYDCVILGPCGTVTSGPAVLNLIGPIDLQTQPLSTFNCVGGPIAFSVTTAPNPSQAFQWRKNGANIPGTNSSTFAIPSVVKADQGAYDVVITTPCQSLTSQTGFLTVFSPNTILSQPADNSFCGLGVFLEVRVDDPFGGSTAQWRKNGVNFFFTQVNSGVSSIGIASVVDTGFYDCVITNNCGAVTTRLAHVTASTPPTISQQPVNQTVCLGSPASFSVQVSNLPAPAFQWRRNGIDVPGANAATINIASAASSNAGAYECVLTSGCGSTTSSPCTLNIGQAVAITQQPAGRSACLGDSVTLAPTVTGTPLGFQWRKDLVNLIASNGPVLFLAHVSAADAGSYDVVVQGPCGSVTSAAAIITTHACSDTLFVNAAATGGDGQSWASAFRDLQAALAQASSSGDTRELWVAGGTYRPASSIRSASFALAGNVALYGGFAGGETARSQRNPALHPTILSGDLAGNDGPGFSNVSENSFHVVTGTAVDSTAVLDGFRLVGGNADGATPNAGGAGLFTSGSPRIESCEFNSNSGSFAGAVWATGPGSFRNCSFHDNRTTSGFGGGAAAGSSPDPVTFTDCSFANNLGQGGGGAMEIPFPGGKLALIGCTFSQNSTASAAGFGGALYLLGGDLTARNCRFLANHTPGRGGAITVFSARTAVTLALTDCIFSGNSAAVSGGGLFVANSASHPTTVLVTNCTFSSDSSASGGGIRDEMQNGSLVLANCVLWGNVAAGAHDEAAQISVSTTAVSINFCSVQGLTGSLPGAGNRAADPLFIDPDGPDNIVGTADDSLGLGFASTCIDAGNNGAVPAGVLLDLAGNARFRDDLCVANTGSGTSPIVDLGALESQAGSCVVAGEADGPPVVRFRVSDPFPNPTARAAEMRFELPAKGRVRVEIYDAGGRRVTSLLDRELPAGRHSARWNGRGASGQPVGAGVYFCRIASPSGTASVKILIIR